VSRLLGQPFMPWQRLVSEVGLELDPVTMLPAYREVIVTVMRQSGKSTLVFGFEVERCLAWGKPQRIAYTAQTGWDARRKLIDDQAPILTSSPLAKAHRKVLRGAGSEGVLFKNGSRIDVMANSVSAGHGRILDLGVIDEAFDDEDDRREQAIVPAMATRADAQLHVVSTAGTSKSLYLRRKVEAGRYATQTDKGTGIAYFEWSIPDDADIDDPETWWTYMPALGWTIGEPVVAHARQTMSDSEFRRGFGNQWTEAEHDRVIPEDIWLKVCSKTSAPGGKLRFAVDCLPDQSAGAITSCGEGVIELVDHRPGTSWMVDRAKALYDNWGGEIVIDGGGPAAYVGGELDRLGIPVVRVNGPELAEACARIYNAIADGDVKFRQHADFDKAVEGLAKRPVGDRFVWSRSTSTTDITPFNAATLAFTPAEAELNPIFMVG
jgi:hypothetical protein